MSNIKYYCAKEIRYYSERYDKWKTIPENYPSDGATFAEDIYSDSWWVHDGICDDGIWDDGTRITNWQASMVLRDILISEKRYIRSWRWFWATFLFGGGEARKNGIFKLKEK